MENGNWPVASQLPGQAWPFINGNILALDHGASSEQNSQFFRTENGQK